MDRTLPRILLTGYGLAAIGALWAALAGVGAVAALLVFWLGGALAVLAVAVLFGARASRERRRDDAETFAEAAARWESDRLLDAHDAASAAETPRQAASDR
ncbi:hypothetical protein COW53_00415 [bacterium CG17_big_fil_post_rev_8_21_14_2_50_64_8]|nr:MAG: hypothetical protein COW53_00415 [bacterium CG17_big_fil_post_rev_8_21_14_2_50_64_8]PIY73432.1 MAG: hypothetical protein COY86_06445 [Rhodobacterales bacterium CG_4_10_14_0_8_um_filter_70_9]